MHVWELARLRAWPAATLIWILLPSLTGLAATPPPLLSRPLTVSDDATDPPTLDPLKQFGDRGHAIIQQIYDGLFQFDPSGRLKPALASSWRRVDALTVEITLREGVRFHNGVPFNAMAVKSTIERYLDPATGYPGRGFLTPICSVTVVSPYKVRIGTDRPDGLLLYRLAAPFVLMVPPDVGTPGGPNLARRPVGTGPFRFVRWVLGSRIEMERNPEYWEPGLPKIPRLTFRFLPMEERIRLLLQGEIDVVPNLPGTQTLLAVESPSCKIVKSPTFLTYLATLDNTRPPLNRREVREALNVSIDRDDLLKYFAKGNGRPLATVSMPGEVGHDPAIPLYPYDPKLAKALLARAGHVGGLKLRFLVKDTARSVMNIIAQQWHRVGIEVEQVGTTDARMIQDLHSGKWDGFMAQSPEPMAHMAFLPGIGVYSAGPFSLVRSPDFDRAYERMISTLDPALQEKRARDVDDLIHRESLLVVTFQQFRTYGLNRRVNLPPSVTAMDYYLYASVDR